MVRVAAPRIRNMLPSMDGWMDRSIDRFCVGSSE